MRRKPGVRQRLRRAESALDAAVFVLAARWPTGQKRSMEEILGLLHAGVAAKELDAEGGAHLLRALARAGWTLDDEEVDVEAWVREQVARIERGEEWVS